MANRVTQDALEAVLNTDPNARVTQDALEAVIAGSGNTPVTQIAVEVLVTDWVTAGLVSQTALEVVIANAVDLGRGSVQMFMF